MSIISVPVVGLAGGWIVLREMPARLSLAGGPVAIAGDYMVNMRKKIIAKLEV